VHELRGSNRARSLGFRREHGICAGNNVRLPALNVVVLAMTFPQFPVSVALVKLASVLFLIFLFAPLGSAREQTSTAPVACPIEFPATETWAQALSNTARSFVKSFWYAFRVAFPLMILAALLGALVIELLPVQLLFASVTIGGILLVALVSAFRPGPMAFDVAIAYIAMTKGVPLRMLSRFFARSASSAFFRSPWSANLQNCSGCVFDRCAPGRPGRSPYPRLLLHRGRPLMASSFQWNLQPVQ
jgi:hypothetical protein